MKTSIFKILVIILIFASSHSLCFAQKMNGLEIGKKYTKEQIISEIGPVTEYYSHPGSERFLVGKNQFMCEDGVFISFSVCDSKYVTLTDLISGGIKVGDNISKVLGIGKNVTMDHQKYSESGENYDAWYRVWFNHSDELYIIFTKNNIITHISFDVSV